MAEYTSVKGKCSTIYPTYGGDRETANIVDLMIDK
jgi:hypothetical protein